MEQKVRVALYCRVSTDLQEKEQTIQSQLEALRRYATDRGYVVVREFIDEGYSGATLERPGLDQLRDRLRTGELDVVIFHSPDRLARKAIYQGLVLEEMEKADVKAEFLNCPVDDSPEGKMLLGMQGLFAEYERAKIMERGRRGRMHWAKQGAMMGGYVSYGYRHINRDRELGYRARLELDEAEAIVVRDMYRWLVEEQLSCRAIARRLTEKGIPTKTGNSSWTPSTVSRILTNEIYKGTFYYHRAEAIEPSSRRRKDAYYGKKLTGKSIRPREEWLSISVPPTVNEATWEAAQKQLHQNYIYSSRHNTRHRYLLRGLIRCPKCGYNCVGTASHGRRNYRCNHHDPLVFPSEKRCGGGWVQADPIEKAVWDAVTEMIQPPVLVQEYQRRLAELVAQDTVEHERKQIELALKRVRIQQDRITDAYVNEAIDLEGYKAKMNQIRERKVQLDSFLADSHKRAQQRSRYQELVADLERFCETVSSGLDNLTFEEKQELLRLVVERIVVQDGKARIEVIIPMTNQGDALRPPLQCQVL